MRDGKQAIRYLGFECRAGGERRLRFSVDEPGEETLLITFDIAGIFFAGEHRILLQEAAGICYSKLKDLLRQELEILSGFALTSGDILQYRQLPSSRRFEKSHHA